MRPRAQRGRDHRRGDRGAGRAVEGAVTEPPAEILRRLRPIPTYTDHPTTTPHDVVGVAPDGTRVPDRRGGGRRAGSAPLPLGGLPRLPGPLGGPARAAGRPRRRRPPGRGDAGAPARRAPRPSPPWPATTPAARGIAVVMSSDAFADYRVGGPPFLSGRRRRRRAHRERGLGPGADAADRPRRPRRRTPVADGAGARRSVSHPVACWPRTERVIVMPTSRDTDIEPEGGLTIDCDCCACGTPTPATTAWSASSSSASPTTPSSSTPTRRGPCACSSAPAWCPTLRFSTRAG